VSSSCARMQILAVVQNGNYDLQMKIRYWAAGELKMCAKLLYLSGTHSLTHSLTHTEAPADPDGERKSGEKGGGGHHGTGRQQSACNRERDKERERESDYKDNINICWKQTYTWTHAVTQRNGYMR
jgi:hypothetical protein